MSQVILTIGGRVAAPRTKQRRTTVATNRTPRRTRRPRQSGDALVANLAEQVDQLIKENQRLRRLWWLLTHGVSGHRPAAPLPVVPGSPGCPTVRQGRVAALSPRGRDSGPSSPDGAHGSARGGALCWPRVSEQLGEADVSEL